MARTPSPSAKTKAKPQSKTPARPQTRLPSLSIPRSVTTLWVIIISLLALPLGYFTLSAYRTGIAFTSAQEALKKGFHQVAFSYADPYRFDLATRERGCSLLVSIYYGVENPDRLEWTGQYCLFLGKNHPDLHLGIAAAKELRGQNSEALEILKKGIQLYPQNPDFFYRAGLIYKKENNLTRASEHTYQAARRAPQNHQLAMEALELLMATQSWRAAAEMADRIQSAPTDNPEVKLIIARAFLRYGDIQKAEQSTDEARKMMTDPGQRSRLEQKYSDVLHPGPVRQPPVAPQQTAQESKKASSSRKPASKEKSQKSSKRSKSKRKSKKKR